MQSAVYLSEGKGRPSRTWLLQSKDQGKSWQILSQIGSGDTNETSLLMLAGGKLLAAARTHVDHHLELFESVDDGNSWLEKGHLTLPMQHPADLLQLQNGEILLTYGIRNRGLFGIGGRISKNRGETWSPPFVLIQLGEARDCGYPSSVQLADKTIITAYYSDQDPNEGYNGYHMGVLLWQCEEFMSPRRL